MAVNCNGYLFWGTQHVHLFLIDCPVIFKQLNSRPGVLSACLFGQWYQTISDTQLQMNQLLRTLFETVDSHGTLCGWPLKDPSIFKIREKRAV